MFSRKYSRMHVNLDSTSIYIENTVKPSSAKHEILSVNGHVERLQEHTHAQPLKRTHKRGVMSKRRRRIDVAKRHQQGDHKVRCIRKR